MRSIVTSLLVVALAGAAVPVSAQTGRPAELKAAVATSSRTPDNIKLDASRKPLAVLRWGGLRQGMKTADLFGGNLYWAEILSPAVGPKGSVTVWEPTQFMSKDGKAFAEKFAAKAGNVTLIESRMEEPNLPRDAFDFVMLNLNYHDVYWSSDKYGIPKMNPQDWLKRVYASIKKGGTLMVIDHVADAGLAPRDSVEKYHRIDPAVIRKDMRQAGFVLAGYSPMLRNASDKHNIEVFDPAVKGKTDRVVFRFRKPA